MIYVLIPFLINGIVSFAGINLLVAHFDPSEYLLYSTAVSAAGVLNAIGFQWIRIYILREMPGQYFQILPHFKNDIRSLLWLYFILAALFVAASYYLNVDKLYWILGVILLAVPQALYEIALALLRAMPDLKGFMQVNFARAIFWSVLLVFIVISEFAHAVVLALLSFSYLFACLFGNWYLNRSMGVNAEDRYESKYSLRSYLPKGFAVSSSVILSFIYLFLMKYGALVEQNDVFVPWFDLVFLACITPLLAANYIYQTKLVLKYERGEKFSSYVAFPVLALGVVLIGSSMFFKLVSMGYLEFPKIDLADYILLVVSMSLLAYKQNWLDHAFYLTRSYWLMALSLLLPMLIVLMLYKLYGLSLYLSAYYYSGLACLMVFATRLEVVAKFMSLSYTCVVFVVLLLIGGMCV